MHALVASVPLSIADHAWYRPLSGPPNNPFKIKCMLEAEHSLLSATWCHLVSRQVPQSSELE